MKKLLSMVLATVLAMGLLFVSMGAMAANTVVWSFGFEDEDVTRVGGQLLDSAENWTVLSADDDLEAPGPASGTKYLRLNRTESDRKYSTFLTGRMPALEAHTQYKLSFYYHGNGTQQYPAIKLGEPINMNGYTRANFVFPNGIKNAWVKFEVYFVTADDLAADTKLSAQLYTYGGIEYYDDFQLERVDGAAIRFISGTATVTLDATLTKTVQANAARYTYYQPRNTYSVGETNPYIWSVISSGIEATNCGDANLKIVSHYLPEAIGETTKLIAVIYRNVSGIPTLQKIQMADCAYDTASIAQTTAMAAHERMDLGFDTMTVDAADLGEGCYIKCFMWSSLSGMHALSDTATLPAAPTAAE